MISMKMEGLDALLRNLGKMESEIAPAVDSYLTLSGQSAKADVKRNTPVDSGNLRKNVKVTRVFGAKRNRMIRVYDPVEYAIYVENDTRTRDKKKVIGGRFMFRKANEKHIHLRDRRINAMLKRIVKAGDF